jgi:Raf kinase inhibitor-like YbhB/YbcL family protein
MRVIVTAVLAAALAGALAACGGSSSNNPTSNVPPAPANLTLTSPAFKAGGTVPREFTCDGEGISPPLRWSSVPKGAKQFALLVEDPDASGGAFVHWTVFDIGPTIRSIEAATKPPGSREGTNSSGRVVYAPLCPPKGDNAHRYVFTLYALKQDLALDQGAQPNELHVAIKSSAAARGQLTGRYARR